MAFGGCADAAFGRIDSQAAASAKPCWALQVWKGDFMFSSVEMAAAMRAFSRSRSAMTLAVATLFSQRGWRKPSLDSPSFATRSGIDWLRPYLKRRQTAPDGG